LSARVLLLALLCAAPASADGVVSTYGGDPTSLSLAGAVVGRPPSFSAAATNPASIARVAGPTLGVGYVLAVPQLSVESENGTPAEDDPLAPVLPPPTAGMSFGAAVPLDLVLDDVFYVGVHGYFPTHVLVRARAFDPARPFFYLYDSATDHYDLAVAFAVRPVSWFSLGVGGRLSAGQTGRADLRLDPVRGRFTSQAIDTFQFPSFAPTVGAHLGPLELGPVRAELGVAWREPATFDVDLPATLGIDGLDIDAVIDLVTLANYSPRSLTGGGSIALFDAVTVGVDVAWMMWSQAPPPFLRARLDLTGEGLENAGLGDALDTPGPGQERVNDPGFEDTVVVKVGVEGKLWGDSLALRAGYQLRPTPVPDQESGTSILDSRAHIIGAGAGFRFDVPYAFDNPLQLDVAWQGQVLEQRETEKARGDDPVGNLSAGGLVHVVQMALTYVW
jgi:hypothetical protein